MYRRWERFQGKPNEFRRKGPHVTLSPKGVILMNRAAYEMAGSPSRVSLLFDKQNGVIGMEPVGAGQPNAFPVKPRNSELNQMVHASPFCRHHDIKVERTMAFNRVKMEGSVLTLELATMAPVGMGGRSL